MRKQIFTGIVCIMLMGMMALPVSAEETPITATVTSSYELSIPAATDIDFNVTSTNLEGTLKVTGNVLPTQTVSVSAQTKPLSNSVQGTTLPYELRNGTSEFSTAT